jgi:hypothetical protein
MGSWRVPLRRASCIALAAVQLACSYGDIETSPKDAGSDARASDAAQVTSHDDAGSQDDAGHTPDANVDAGPDTGVASDAITSLDFSICVRAPCDTPPTATALVDVVPRNCEATPGAAYSVVWHRRLGAERCEDASCKPAILSAAVAKDGSLWTLTYVKPSEINFHQLWLDHVSESGEPKSELVAFERTGELGHTLSYSAQLTIDGNDRLTVAFHEEDTLGNQSSDRNWVSTFDTKGNELNHIVLTDAVSLATNPAGRLWMMSWQPETQTYSVAALDAARRLLWLRTDLPFSGDLVPGENDSLVIAGLVQVPAQPVPSRAFLELDPEGRIVWDREIPEPFYTWRTVSSDALGRVALAREEPRDPDADSGVAYQGNEFTVVRRMDTHGKISWGVRIDETISSSGINVQTHRNGGIVALHGGTAGGSPIAAYEISADGKTCTAHHGSGDSSLGGSGDLETIYAATDRGYFFTAANLVGRVR